MELPNRQTHCLCAEENSLLLTTRQVRIQGEHFRVALLPLTGFRGRVSLAKTMRPAGWKWLDHGLTEAIIPLREALGHKAENRYERLLLHSLTSTLVYQSLGLAEEPLPPCRTTRGRPRYDLLTESAKEYISKHYSHPLTLGEIAYAVGVSEEHLARLFQTTTGTSVMAFLFEYRARQAKSLLLQNRLSIAEVAYRCGFQTVGHFYRTFRAVFDQTPGGIRSGEK